MSRSVKKHWITKDCNSFMKNYANRRLRRIVIINEGLDEDLSGGKINISLNNNSYRKYTSPYEISDWGWRTSLVEIKKDAYEELHPTAKDYYHSFIRIKRPKSEFESEQDYINHYTVMYGKK